MDITLTIAKHSVAICDSCLSPLQEDLLDHKAKIRIVNAPTGAGKTYAFQKALAKRQQRILFIVPTRRLAQNIAGGLVNDLVQQEGWTANVAEKKVAIWSSDESTRLTEEEGIENIRGFRIRQLQGLDSTRPEGEMIIAIPEVVSHLLLNRTLDLGHAGMGVFDVLNAFDHIVFDEFHTIQAQGFGLATLFAKLAPYFGRAKVSLLSATPLNIKPVMLKLGINAKHIKELKETIVKDSEQSRPLHGDVILSFSDSANMQSLIREQIELIKQEVSQGRQVVIIYNALRDLRDDLSPLASLFKSVGIQLNQVLAINSIDDSGGNHIMNCGFHVGQKRNPDDFSILLATASVEIGVTFRDANVMLMESGFEPMNFLQRYGRAARRGQNGQVFVRIDHDSELRNPWLRDIKNWAKQHQNSQQSIQSLTKVVSNSVISPSDKKDSESGYFGELSTYAEYCAGLYWQILMKHPSNKGYRGRHLWEYQPNSSKLIYALLKTVRQFETDETYARYTKEWLKHLYGQALQYRDIGKQVIVIEGNGRGRHLKVSRLWLERETDLLHYWQEDEDGNEFYLISGEIDDYLLDNKNRANRQLETYFPHTPQTEELTADASLVSRWCRLLMDKRNRDSEYALEDFPEAMKAAKKIVQLTGLVPSEESVLSDANLVGVLS